MKPTTHLHWLISSHLFVWIIINIAKFFFETSVRMDFYTTLFVFFAQSPLLFCICIRHSSMTTISSQIYFCFCLFYVSINNFRTQFVFFILSSTTLSLFCYRFYYCVNIICYNWTGWRTLKYTSLLLETYYEYNMTGPQKFAKVKLEVLEVNICFTRKKGWVYGM